MVNNDISAYKEFLPKGAKTVGVVDNLPGNPNNYVGEVAIVLTEDALYLVTPIGGVLTIAYGDIRKVTTKSLIGVLVPEEIAGRIVSVNPLDAHGVTVEYETVGKFTSELSFLTRYFHVADLWRGKISQEISEYHNRVYKNRFPQDNPPNDGS